MSILSETEETQLSYNPVVASEGYLMAQHLVNLDLYYVVAILQ